MLRTSRKNWLKRFTYFLFGVLLLDSIEGGVVVNNGDESSMVSKVKEKQDNDPLLLELLE